MIRSFDLEDDFISAMGRMNDHLDIRQVLACHPLKLCTMADNSLAKYGTPQPIDVSTVSAKERNAHLPLHLQEARDEQGRKRLHGAFTGGWSAGYFNTVGSKEGWTPSTFVSSRKDRSAKRNFTPQDFMDAEDLQEMESDSKIGVTNTFEGFGFTQQDSKRQRRDAGPQAHFADVVEDLLLGPPEDPVGTKLMRQMGWRQGQGIGPRQKRAASDLDGDAYAADILFAPKEVSVDALAAKANTFGLGYDPYRGAQEFSRFSAQRAGGADQIKLAGGFGIGALEEEDDDDEDIYGDGQQAMYVAADVNDEGVTKQERKEQRAPFQVTVFCTDGRTPLPGFKLVTRAASIEPTWREPPNPPNGYTARPCVSTEPLSTSRTGPGHKTSVDAPLLATESRREALGETALDGPARSVFSYISVKEQARLATILQSASKRIKDAIPAVDARTAEAALNGYKPFKDAKAERYRAFLEFKASNTSEDVQKSTVFRGLSEQESLQEELEFAKAALLFKPLSGAMASRFTSSGSSTTGQDASDSNQVPTQFGVGTTRSRTLWKPMRLLCKRFNVPVPDHARDQSDRDDQDNVKGVLDDASMDALMKDRIMNPSPQAGPQGSSPAAIKALNDGAAEDEEVRIQEARAAQWGESETFVRPSMDVFQLIFNESSSSEEEEEEEDESISQPNVKSANVPESSLNVALEGYKSLVTTSTSSTAQGTLANASSMVSETDQAPLPPPTFRPVFKRREERIPSQRPTKDPQPRIAPMCLNDDEDTEEGIWVPKGSATVDVGASSDSSSSSSSSKKTKKKKKKKKKHKKKSKHSHHKDHVQ